MPVTTKEIALIILDVIIAVILIFLSNRLNFDIDLLKESITTIVVIIIASAVIIMIVYKKFDEVNKELEVLETEQKRLLCYPINISSR